ncbi:nuclear transport factor 2 family protein [soil metagenome]
MGARRRVSGLPSADMEPTYASIARLVFGYAERLDAGDIAGMAGLFAGGTLRTVGPDGVTTFTGTDEVYGAFANSVQRYDDGTPATKHVTTNLIVDEAADGESASGRALFTVLQARPDFPLQIVVAGRYTDSFVREQDGWRFADRLIQTDLIGDVSRHLVVEIPQ